MGKIKKDNTNKKKESGKTLCIVLMSLILIISGTFGLTLTLISNSKKEVKNISKEIIKNIGKKETSIVFQKGKITYGKIKLKKFPQDGNATVDKEGNVAITINNGRWCAVKDYYSNEIKVQKYSKENCKLSKSATEIIKSSKNITKAEEDSNLSYYYKGENPDNHIIFAERCFRIIGITNDDNIRIIYEGYADNNKCENNKNGYSVIEKSSYGEDNNWYNEKNNAREKIENYIKDKNMNKKIAFTTNDIKKLTKDKFYVGAVNRNDDIKTLIKNERTNNNGTTIEKKDEYVYESYIGMINVSDYINASADENCKTVSDVTSNPDHPCASKNYLYKDGYPYWTMNAVSGTSNKVWKVSGIGSLLSSPTNKDNVYIRTVLNLNKNIVITGKGTERSPFIVE